MVTSSGSALDAARRQASRRSWVSFRLGGMPALAFEVREDTAAGDPILAILRLMADVRVRPARLDDFLSANHVREFPEQGTNLVGRFESVPAALTQVDDASHAGQGTRQSRS